MPIAVVVSAVAALVVALITATVTLYSKRLDRRLAVEGRHAAARESAYDLLLTAGDAAWNFIARNYVNEVTTGEPLSEDEKEAGAQRANALLTQAIDQLEAAAADMDAVRPIIRDFYLTIFANHDGSAEEYERARQNIVNCRRRDSGLREILQEGTTRGWRRFAPVQAVLAWRLRRNAARNLRPTYRGIEVDQVLRTEDGVTLVAAKGNDFLAVLEEQRAWQRGMHGSIAVTEARLDHWRKKGTWQ